METSFLPQDKLRPLLEKLQEEYALFVPVKKDGHLFYEAYPEAQRDSNGRQLTLGEVRGFEPLKAFFFRARQKVAENYQDTLPLEGEKPLCLAGVKACDLKGFTVLDKVFSETEYRDPFYVKAREEYLILSADCTAAIETCFCLALHGTPYPREDYDLNLSQVKGGHIAEAGSEKGKKLLSKYPDLFLAAPPELVQERDRQRQRVTREVQKNIGAYSIPDQDRLAGAIKKSYDSPLWEEEARDCVECGACNAICPTCHCFLLYDQKDEKSLSRFRLWDSCLIKDFAQVAGGANPRPRLWMRLRNRFEKKFDFFPAVNHIYACTGCGRCIAACPAKIDIREVLRRNVEDVPK